MTLSANRHAQVWVLTAVQCPAILPVQTVVSCCSTNLPA